MDFEDQSVLLVSGTARSARVMARKIAKAGGTVAFTYYEDEAKADDLLEDLEGDRHFSRQCDVTSWDEVRDVVDDAFDRLGEIDSLIYTTGVFGADTIADTSVDDWNWQIQGNATGAFHVLKAAAPYFSDQEHGSIVALSASPGMFRETEFGAFDASKAGLEAVVLEVARELGPRGVRANVVAPGFIRTEEDLSDDELEQYLDQVPLKRVCTDEDVANLALFLCSDYAAQVTGAVVPVDGGMAIAPP